MPFCPVDLKKEQYTMKTDKDGAFYKENKAKLDDPGMAGSKVKITGKLLSPSGIGITFSFSFNGVKKSYPEAKSGKDVVLGIYVLKAENVASIDGTTNPATPNTDLKFEAGYAPCV
jgi:hypothetical protein